MTTPRTEDPMNMHEAIRFIADQMACPLDVAERLLVCAALSGELQTVTRTDDGLWVPYRPTLADLERNASS
jgi:hypothetical protein